ncbi:Uncharacterized protein TCAP_00731 [Tolypocladium capitatum]|uniref:Golgi apparatus membrane protein TVP15 n=1 Tax=Tolypocladium capitatum TaxID=45235 RepID=A0A2K3QPA1_9HYPO|nr:Uncharacterized protein TCAP_00731 [Tolypocladium capitatum]
MELSDIFRIVNLVVATIAVVGGIAQIFGFTLYVRPPIDPVESSMPSSTATMEHGGRIPVKERLLILNCSQTIVVGAYMIVFGLSIALLEFQVPAHISRYASFLFSFVGRGAFYIFIGSLLLGLRVIQNIAGAVVGIIGVCYVILEFIPAIEPPSNMREADAAGWGAEQV